MKNKIENGIVDSLSLTLKVPKKLRNDLGRTDLHDVHNFFQNRKLLVSRIYTIKNYRKLLHVNDY